MDTENLPPQPSSSDSETDSLDKSDSFEERQLTGAEIDYTGLLPKVEGLCITGEAKLGHTLYAAGFSANGTVSCDFAWLRIYDTGGRVYIPEEKQPWHLVTADDVDSYLAVEVIPKGKDGEMGDLVRVFANEHKKVTCGNKIQDAVEQSFFGGHASFDVCFVEYNEDRQNVKLEFMEDKFIIKDEKLHHLVKMNFLPDMTIAIPRESPTGFEIQSMEGFQSLKLEASSSEVRDLIVLTMRSFLLRATQISQKKKPSRKCFFLLSCCNLDPCCCT